MADADENAPFDTAAPGGAPPPAPLPKAPRANPPTVGQRREKAPSGAKMTMGEVVAWLGRMDLGPDRPDEEPSGPEVQPTRESRQFRRMQSAAARAARMAAARAHEGAAAEAGFPEDGAPRTEDGAIIPELTPRGERRVNPPAAGLFSNVVAQCIVLVLMGLCFVLGRVTLPARPPAAVRGAAPAVGSKEPAAGNGVPGPTMALLDQALAAQNNDPGKAVKLLERLRGGGQHISGLEYELGWLAYRNANYPEALLALNRSIAQGEEVSESYDLRGMITGGRLSGLGTLDFEAATQANPFAANAFFHWGEALRRVGKPRQALVHLQQALDRAQTPGARTVYELKIRLTQIELGEEEDFAPALAAALAQPQPATEWLLTAAAQELHNGNYRAATASLERARQFGNLPFLSAALRDYFFLGFAERTEIADEFAKIFGQPAPAPPTVIPELPAVSFPAPPTAPATNPVPGQ
jgi:hypothetical protein